MGKPIREINLEDLVKVPTWVKIKIAIWLFWVVYIPALPALPPPIHFGVVANLFMFLLLPIMPHHIMAIPIAFGGGLAGALLIVGGSHAKPKRQ
jgi:hypothetical protein